MSILNHTKDIIIRDLQVMKTEIENTNSDLLWVSEPGIINSVGTLCYHICGNLNHFIGNNLGNNGYIRNREAEFNRKDLSKDDLIILIDDTIEVVNLVLSNMKEIELDRDMPEPPTQHQGKSIGYFLIQLCCHLSRHRGQLDYLRRIKNYKK